MGKIRSGYYSPFSLSLPVDTNTIHLHARAAQEALGTHFPHAKEGGGGGGGGVKGRKGRREDRKLRLGNSVRRSGARLYRSFRSLGLSEVFIRRIRQKGPISGLKLFDLARYS